MSPNSEEPQSTPPVDNESGYFVFAKWCLKAIAAIFIMAMGALYGIVAYKLFSYLFSDPSQGNSGLMLVSFLAGIPLLIGLIVGYNSSKKKLGRATVAGGISSLSISLFIFVAGALLREGTICIVMAIPIFFILGIIGAILGLIFSSVSKNGSKLYSLTLFLPLVLGSFETQVTPPSIEQNVEKEIFIQASPELIWQYINNPHDIKPKELEAGFAYRIGVPFPIQASTLEERVGGKRELIWQRGVHFEEEITAWELNRHIAWTYKFSANSFPPGSLDDHIVIGGKYFTLEDTSYTLIPEQGGTRLRIKVTSQTSTNFNWYAGLWANFLVSDTAENILKFYKNRAEAKQIPAKT